MTTPTTPPGEQTGMTTDQLASLAESLSIANQPDTMGPFRFWHEHSPHEKQRWLHMVEVGVCGWLEEHSMIIAPAASVIGPDQRAALGRLLEVHDAERAVPAVRRKAGAYSPDLAAAFHRLGNAKSSVTTADLALLRDLAAGGGGDE